MTYGSPVIWGAYYKFREVIEWNFLVATLSITELLRENMD